MLGGKTHERTSPQGVYLEPNEGDVKFRVELAILDPFLNEKFSANLRTRPLIS